MKVSEFYGLNKQQALLDFVDVPLNTDLKVFVDPTSIRKLDTLWGHELQSALQSYFACVLNLIRAGKKNEAIEMLANLREGNEFHLGYSRRQSRGHAFGNESAVWVYDSLKASKAFKTGLLQDLEDTALLIPGVGPDMISDGVCNIIRKFLIEYTQDVCRFYNIPMEKNVASGLLWDPDKLIWYSELVDLPVAGGYGLVVLVPKLLVRHSLSYSHDRYYHHYLLPMMADEEIRLGTSLVRVLKSGEKKVAKKDLKEKYGKNKYAIVDKTIEFPDALGKYRNEVKNSDLEPLQHEELADIQEEKEVFDWKGLKKRLGELPVGKEYSKEYEDLIQEIFTALFYPNLCMPKREESIHEGRKRMDVAYRNQGIYGFFKWISSNYPSSIIPVECKNYSGDIKNPEVDQLSGRFSINRGQVGILTYRKSKDEKSVIKRCRDTANDGRGFVVPINDNDIINMIDLRIQNSDTEHQILREKFEAIIK